VPLIALFAVAGSYGLATRRGSAGPKRCGPFELSVWFPPDSSQTILQPLSGASGCLGLYDETHSLSRQRLRLFSEVQDGGFKEERVIDWTTQDPWSVRTIWPDGQVLCWYSKDGSGTGKTYRYDVFDQASLQRHSGPTLAFRYHSDSDRGLAVIRNNKLYILETNLSYPDAPDKLPVDLGTEILAVDPNHVAPVVEAVPHVSRRGYAWDGTDLTLAVLKSDGSIWVLRGEPPVLQEDQSLAKLGATAISLPVDKSTFYLAKDFCLFKVNGSFECIDRMGAQLALSDEHVQVYDSTGKPVGPVEALIGLGFQHGSKSVQNKLAAYWETRVRHRGRTTDPAVYSHYSQATLISANTIILADKDFHRLNIIRHRPETP
jgi:hypothetical protein